MTTIARRGYLLLSSEEELEGIDGQIARQFLAIMTHSATVKRKLSYLSSAWCLDDKGQCPTPACFDMGPFLLSCGDIGEPKPYGQRVFQRYSGLLHK